VAEDDVVRLDEEEDNFEEEGLDRSFNGDEDLALLLLSSLLLESVALLPLISLLPFSSLSSTIKFYNLGLHQDIHNFFRRSYKKE